MLLVIAVNHVNLKAGSCHYIRSNTTTRDAKISQATGSVKGDRRMVAWGVSLTEGCKHAAVTWHILGPDDLEVGEG